jgi:hypothetical protein
VASEVERLETLVARRAVMPVLDLISMSFRPPIRRRYRGSDLQLEITHENVAWLCAAANPAGASLFQSLRPVRRVAELGSLCGFLFMTIFALGKLLLWAELHLPKGFRE